MGLKVIDFSAKWCFPCKRQAPIFEDVMKEYEFKGIEFEKIDIDMDKKKAIGYNVMAVPTILILKDNEEVRRFVGLTDKKDLIKEIEKHTKKE